MVDDFGIADPSRITLGQLAEDSRQLALWLGESIVGLSWDGSPRYNSANACFANAIECHQAIATLISNDIYSAAFALMRPLYEGHVRGIWLSHCATDAQVLQFVRDKDFRLADLIQAIEANEIARVPLLSEVKQRAWRSFCSYAHSGALQVQRWLGKDGELYSHHSPDEAVEVLQFANVFGTYSALAFAANADGDEVFLKLLHRAANLPRGKWREQAAG